TLDRPARYEGGRLGFAAGPFDVAVSYSQERFANSFGYNALAAVSANNGFNYFIPAGKAYQRTANIGGSYDFGFMKLLGYFDYERLGNFREKMYSVSGVIPLGQSEIHLGYNRSNGTIGTYSAAKVLTSNNIYGPTQKNVVWQAAATYQYNLSKRTAIYGTGSYLKNADNTRFNIASGTGFSALPTNGGNSRGFELGIRHFF
ncbi:MAG: porin, partial [Pseudomonadota bacterium]|nr:porin [Pseudomonadota bacterium]